MADTENRPVLTGLIALVGVALVIGALGGLGDPRGGQGDRHRRELAHASSESTTSATFRLPQESTDTGQRHPEHRRRPRTPARAIPQSETPADAIALSAGQLTVSPMQQIDLTGTYATGEGAVLQVQRFEDGAWQDFPVTAPVTDSTFSTYVETSRVGPNKFRVIDSDTEKISNEVTVTVG